MAAKPTYEELEKKIKDLEEEKSRIQTQLLQTQKMETMDTMAGGIAHEFNNILGAILGYVELVMFDLPEGSQPWQNLDQVLKAGYRAKGLVRQILAFSHQRNEQIKPLQLSLIIKDALKLLRASLPMTIEIRLHVADDSGLVLADQSQLLQVLMSLCTKAAQAMREKGGALTLNLDEVDVDANAISLYPGLQPGVYVKVDVSDTGPGIDPTIGDRIFDPDFSIEKAAEGTGMGLTIAQGIVKTHGGTITAESTLGKGTTFHLLLPVIKRKSKTEIEPLRMLRTGSERILFVDDEEPLVDTAKQMLSLLGYSVVGKTNSLEALKTFQTEPDQFDLVITDTTMPNMTGVELAKALLTIRPNLPVILCTGFTEIITPEEAKGMGIREFVLKPLVIRDISNAIRKVLDED